MTVTNSLKFSTNHLWLRYDGDLVYVGLTHYLQDILENIVFIQLPETDKRMNSGDIFCIIESEKSVLEIHLPISGVIHEVNQNWLQNLNQKEKDFYHNWIASIILTKPEEFDSLLDAEVYHNFTSHK
ncbi:MAG: hypothetical protein K6U80_15615 [Firmicutes bacterium]|nr:hypothetical protein [Bacillota bacterium]